MSSRKKIQRKIKDERRKEWRNGKSMDKILSEGETQDSHMTMRKMKANVDEWNENWVKTNQKNTLQKKKKLKKILETIQIWKNETKQPTKSHM